MKEALIGGLAVIVMGCSTPRPVTPMQLIEQDFKHRGIVIKGPLTYIQNTAQALELIYTNDPINWAVVQNNITAIRFNPPSGIYVHSGIYDTDANITTPTQYQPLQWVAGEIVHDAWHREYFCRGEAYMGWEGEKKCMERQNEFFTKIGFTQTNVEQMLQTRYWETQRNW